VGLHDVGEVTAVKRRILVLLCVVACSIASSTPTWAGLLTPAEVQSLTWPPGIPSTLCAASDGVFQGGPHYRGADTDAWISQTDVFEDGWEFPLSVQNTSAYPIDDVIVLIAHRGGTFSSVTVGGFEATPASFYPSTGRPFGADGRRPGDGEAALYSAADRVLFIELRQGIPAGATLEIPVRIDSGRADLEMHFDTYGLRRAAVCSTGGQEYDVTLRPRIIPNSALSETWTRIKAFFAF
jgi:hypothetical protein